jgi:hypothetical protein
VAHIGDEAGDLGHGIGLLERPVNDFHDFVITPCEPVVAGIEFIASSQRLSLTPLMRHVGIRMCIRKIQI